MGSLLLKCAESNSVPAGTALAVDRGAFAREITDSISKHHNIRVIREEVKKIPDRPTIIASGPLTSQSLSESLLEWSGQENLFFYDAIAPIVVKESIDMKVAYQASRFNRGEVSIGDYINCPLEKDQYEYFVDELINAEKIGLKEFEKDLKVACAAWEF
jgi:methylenetetrahydrofolate--tRNA-(uracil-5-)-methyltransferase